MTVTPIWPGSYVSVRDTKPWAVFDDDRIQPVLRRYGFSTACVLVPSRPNYKYRPWESYTLHPFVLLGLPLVLERKRLTDPHMGYGLIPLGWTEADA